LFPFTANEILAPCGGTTISARVTLEAASCHAVTS
jgi:hypothetical protein